MGIGEGEKIDITFRSSVNKKKIVKACAGCIRRIYKTDINIDKTLQDEIDKLKVQRI